VIEMRIREHARRLLLLAVLASLAGCASPASSSSVVPTVNATPSASATSVPTPAIGTPAVSPSPPGAAGLALDLKSIGGDWARSVGPMAASDGRELVWAVVNDTESGDPPLPDLASFVPGSDREPHIFYRHPDRDSSLWEVAVRDGHYAFLEMNARTLGENGWRLWVIPSAGAPAVPVDRSDDSPTDGRPAALFVLTGRGIAWTAVHDRGGTPTFEIRTARFDGSQVRTVLASPKTSRQYWYPSIDADGTHLLVGSVEPAAGGHAFELWSVDLDAASAQTLSLGPAKDAAQPVANASALAWRTADGNVGNWSPSLVVAHKDGSAPISVPVDGIANLSIGNRFIAFDPMDAQAVELYDLEAGRLVTVERHSPPDTRGYQPGWTIVAGDLLVFRRVDYYNDNPATAVPAEIVWATLPAPGR
jgi:hypothetical protein